MRRLGAGHRVAAVAMMVLLVTACGGDDSSGLATLVGTATTAPLIDPEQVEPVSEPTAVTQAESAPAEPPEPPEPVPSAAADPVDDGLDGTPGAGGATESEGATGGEPVAPEDTNGGETVAPEDTNGGEPVASEGATGGESAEPGDLTDEEQLLAFAECMRENGVDFPDPVVEADGTVTFGFRPGGGFAALREIGRDPDLPAAREACQGLVEGLAFGPGPGGFDMIELQDRLLEFAQCMRDNGIDIGDPDLSRFAPGADDGGQPGGPFGVIDTDDPDFAPAFEICQQQLPQPGQGGGFGGGG